MKEHALLQGFGQEIVGLLAAHGFPHGKAIQQLGHQPVPFLGGVKQGPDGGTGGVEVDVLGGLGMEQANLAIELSGADNGIALKHTLFVNLSFLSYQ